jgi:large subunit ribosomal protein L1
MSSKENRALCKRMQKASAARDAGKSYSLDEAVALVKSMAAAKFDETVDIAVGLNIDPRQSDQNIRGMVQMPAGTGQTVRVAVFARGEKEAQAREAGADLVGSDDLVEQILAGQIDFERCIATPDLMGLVGKVARVLGPRGLMPNPKLGTVTTDVAAAVKAARSGQVEYRCEKAGILHAGIGKVSFAVDDLARNILAFMSAVVRSKPAAVKGTYVRKLSLSSTMGPSVKVDMAGLYARINS